MTTTQTERADLSKGPARIDSQMIGGFPSKSQLPPAAAEPIEQLMLLRERSSDANDDFRAAINAVEKAKLADAAALLEHVRGGGKAADFQGTTQSAMRAVEFAQADVNIIEKLLNEQCVATALAVQGMHDQGAEMAKTATAKATKRYSEAIAALQQARQDYLNCCGVELFWRYLVEKGRAVVPGGHEIITQRGPITTVDFSTITLLRQDAETHTRVPTAHL